MPFKEALFWIALTVFGTGFFFAVEGGDRLTLGIIVTGMGLVGLIYSIYAHYNPVLPKVPIWVALLIVTWVALGYDIFHTSPKSTISTSVRLEKFQFIGSKYAGHDPASIEAPVPGKEICMNLGVRDFGPLPARDVSISGKVLWSQEMSKTEESDAWNDFTMNEKSSEPRDVDVDDGQWSSYCTPALKNTDVGTGKTLYVLMLWKYTDNGGNHSTEYCRYLQTPLTHDNVPIPVQMSAESYVWRECLNKRSIR